MRFSNPTGHFGRSTALALTAVLFAGAAAFADDEKAEGDAKAEATKPLTVAAVTFDVPESWKEVELKSKMMRKAQYALPSDDGDAELIVFYFGPGQGGDTEANIKRWAGQFKSGDQGTPTPETTVIESNGLKSTIVRVEGTYAPSSMRPGAPAPTPETDQALYGDIVEGGPQGTLFIKVVGPKKTIEHWEKSLDAFAKSARPEK